MRAEVAGQGGPALSAQVTAGAEPSPADLIAELVSAGLVSIEVADDGDISYALTPEGQSTARAMAMSQQPYALVLLGALMGADEVPNPN